MKKILKYLIGAIILAASYGVYIYFAATGGSPETATSSKSDVAQGKNPLGKLSDGSFANYSTAQEFDKRTTVEYLTVSANQINETEFYMRKGWVDARQQTTKRSGRRSRTTTKQVPVFSTFSITNREYMVPIYAITLSGGGVIGAVIEDEYVSALKNGETITLPIGQKVQLAQSMGNKFANAENGGVAIKSVYYALNDEWYTQNASSIKTKAIIFAIVAFILLVLATYFGAGKLFSSDNKE